MTTTEAHPPAPATTADIPGSKSLTNRALVLAAAADGTTRLHRPLVSDDAVAMSQALQGLGVRVRVEGDTWAVDGLAGGPTGDHSPVWCHDAGTAARFLPPFAARGTGTFAFDGSDQLRSRPLGPLLDALRGLGTEIDGGDRLPFTLGALPPDRRPGTGQPELELPSRMSSQYLTGLLLTAPLMPEGLRIAAPGLVSRPYIDMTIALMERFGARVDEVEPDVFAVAGGGLTAADLVIEPDASTASYFFAAAAISGRSVFVPGLGRRSVQGDLRFVEVLRQLGARVDVGEDGTTVDGGRGLSGGVTLPMGDISDTFMTLAAIAPLAEGPIRIEGIGHTRLKESDRIEAMATNLTACGVPVAQGSDWIEISPAAPQPATIRCFRDHRIAMSFSVLGLRAEGLVLDDPDCVSKTFPGFHAEFGRVFGA